MRGVFRYKPNYAFGESGAARFIRLTAVATMDAAQSAAEIIEQTRGIIEYPDSMDVKNRHTARSRYFTALSWSSAPTNTERFLPFRAE